MVRRALVSPSLLLFFVAACGASKHEPHHGAHPDFPACATLAKTCHPHDKDSEKAHACHVLGHSAQSNEECEARRAECATICGGTVE